MFILHFLLAVFSFSEMIIQFLKGDNYFALFSSMYSFFKKTKTGISRLLFKNSERARSSQLWNERDAFDCFGELKLVISHRGIPITQALK